MLIKNCVNLPEVIYQQIVSIFFETSAKKSFKDLNEKRSFQFNYLDYYLEKFPQFCFYAIKENRVLGYIVASSNSNYHFNQMDYYHYFEKFLTKYPSHLHINCSSLSQGQGVGSKLWQELRGTLISNQIHSLHIITTRSSRNVGFYQKNSFKEVHSVNLDTYELIMMAVSF